MSAAVALGLLAGVTGCKFAPRIPDAVVSCSSDDECPRDFVCSAKLARCCRAGVCPEGPVASPPPAPARPDAGALPPMASVDAGSPFTIDAEPALPQPSTPGDAGDAAAGDANDGGGPLPLVCSGTEAVVDLGAGRQSFCTIVARGEDVALAIHSLLPNDAVSTRTYGVCSASLPIERDVLTGGQLLGTTIASLGDLAVAYKKICDRHNARLVGTMVHASWGSKAGNLAELRSRLMERTGAGLDLFTQEEELQQSYLGVTRNRRGRIVLRETVFSPQLLSWPKGSATVIRDSLPGSWEVINMAYANASYPTFEDARRALRARLDREIEGPLLRLEAAIADGSLAPGVAVGSAGPMIPLAIGGQLRDARGAWAASSEVNRKVSEATIGASPYGRIYGGQPLLPAQLDAFFPTIDAGQWQQLRSEPLRTAYGGELFYMTTLLDLLADEIKATEFPFVYAHAHLGYLFGKVLPPAQ